MQRYRTVIILVLLCAIPLIGAIVLAGFFWPSQPQPEPSAAVKKEEPPPEPPKTRKVLAAARFLPVGALLGEEDVVELDLEAAAVRPGYIFASETAMVGLRGHAVRKAITAGMPLTRAAVVGPRQRGFLAAVLKPGTRAVTIQLEPGARVAGLIDPGDRVDVILSAALRSADGPENVLTRTILQDVRVVAVDNMIGVAAKTGDESESVARTEIATATLEVQPAQAARLSLAKHEGQISLAVRSLVAESGPLSPHTVELQNLLTPPPEPPEPPRTQTVLAAARPLPVGTLLGDDDVVEIDLQWAAVRPGHILADATAMVGLRGHAVRKALAAGLPLTRAALVGPGQRGFLAAVLRPGTRAVNVQLEGGERDAELIDPGAHVDVILTAALPAAKGAASVLTRTILEHVRVVAVDHRVASEVEGLRDRKDARAGAGDIVATLEVRPGASRQANSRQARRAGFAGGSFVGRPWMGCRRDGGTAGTSNALSRRGEPNRRGKAARCGEPADAEDGAGDPRRQGHRGDFQRPATDRCRAERSAALAAGIGFNHEEPSVKFDERFSRAVAALPGSIRERLDGEAPLDWTLLQDARTGTQLEESARAHRRLPEIVERLVPRLVREVGIVAEDVAAGVERQRAAFSWMQRVAVEPEGESYRLRNTRTGEVLAGVSPEAIAGYATLALEVAAAVYAVQEQWIEVGNMLEEVPESELTPLQRYAMVMRAELKSEAIHEHATTMRIADSLERCWNAQGFEARAAFSAVRLSTARGARPPEENHYAPITGYRLRAGSLGEIRWLGALVARAATGALPSVAGEDDDRTPQRATEGTADSQAVEDATLADMRTLEARIQAATSNVEALELGTDAEEVVLDWELAELGRVAKRLSGPVRRRLGNAYGIEVSQALTRLQDTEEADAVRAGIGAPGSGRTVPQWLQDLAAVLLMDTGASTQDGARTAGLRLEVKQAPEEGYAVTDVETGAQGHLTQGGLVRQIRLSLTFVQEVWNGLAMLRSAGREGHWTLNEGQTEGRVFAADERRTLEVARRIEQALQRAQRAHARENGNRVPSTLEQASMAAGILVKVDPEICAAAGWDSSAGVLNARNPADIARIAAVGEGLRGKIRTIANEFIVGGIASAPTYREAYEERRRAPAEASAEPSPTAVPENGRPLDADTPDLPDRKPGSGGA